MARTFPVVRDEAYDEMAATYQVIEMGRLNEVLEKHKVPLEVRRAICRDYCFDSGVFLDCGWLKIEEKQVFATLCFAERPVDPVEGLGEIAKLYAPSEFFSFHEYASGCEQYYFEENKQGLGDIEHGNL